jgi:hypothetical protein
MTLEDRIKKLEDDMLHLKYEFAVMKRRLLTENNQNSESNNPKPHQPES